MPTPIDIDQLVKDLKAAATGVLQKDVSTFRGFAERQLRSMADQAKMIADGWSKGDLTDEQRDAFLTDLKEQAKSFARVLEGLVALEIEKVWNALVKTLWDAISAAAGKALPI